MKGLIGSSPLPWDQPAAVHEGQPALGASTLGKLGSSYLDADCILDNCPSRDTFLLPDDADDPPAPLPRQHSVSTASASFPPIPSSQPPPAGPPGGIQHAETHAGSAMHNNGACRVPARLSTHLSSAGAGIRRTAGVSPHTVPSSSGAWDKQGASMALNSAHAASRSSRAGAQSPLVSARTVAALMAGEDDLQQASLDLLGMDGALMPLEGDLLWGAGAQMLPESTPPTAPGAGAPAQLRAAPAAQGASSVVMGQQYQQHQQAHQQKQAQQQLRLLGTASPVGLGYPGSRQGLAGSPAAGFGSPAAQSRQQAPLVDAYHPQYQQYQQQQAAYNQQQQQHQQQLQHAYLAQRQQQLGAHAGHSSSRRVARVLHPIGLQPGRTVHAGGAQQHPQQQQHLSAHQHMHQQQQQQVYAQAQVHGMQQQQLTQQGSLSSPAGWQATAAAAGGVQGSVAPTNGFVGAAAVLQPTGAGNNAAVTAALHTWGSNTSSMTAAADASGSPGGTTTAAAAAAAAGGGASGGVRSSETPTDSSRLAATAASMTAGSSGEQQRQIVARSTLASAGSGTQQFQAATLAALENCFPAPPAGTSVAQGQGTKEQQQLQQLLALAQGSVGGAATAPQDASSPAAAAATAPAAGAGALAAPPPAAAAAAENTASAPAGTQAAAANAAASPLKGLNSGAGVVSLSSANSGSMGDSSHDSSQTQQQDAGSAEPPAAATAAADLTAAAAATGTAADVAAVAADAAAAAAASGVGEEGLACAPQPRVFHHKGGGPCDHCGVMESPQWRRGPPAKPILCNACGTRYRRTHHLGPPIPSGGRVGGPRPQAAGSSGGSSGGGSTPGRKRAAAAEALGPAPLPVNFEGGVHTGTRRARNPNRPALKQYRIEDV